MTTATKNILSLALIVSLFVAAAVLMLSGCSGRQSPGHYKDVPPGQTNIWMPAK